MTKRKSTKG